MKKLLIALTLTLLSTQSQAACRWVWVDHDHNTATPAIRKQICDNAFDPPAVNMPSIQPIQRPQIRPIQTPTIPPIGTTQCRIQSVYNPVTRQWENKRICY